MNTTRLLRCLYLTLLIALMAMLVLPPIVLGLLILSFLIFGSWFEMPVCWATLAACSGYEKAAFFVLLYAASGWIADPFVDFLRRRTGAKERRSTQRLGLSVMLAVLMAAGAYAYLTFGGEGAAAILSVATSQGIVVLGLAAVVARSQPTSSLARLAFSVKLALLSPDIYATASSAKTSESSRGPGVLRHFACLYGCSPRRRPAKG
jgi:hypothetical protein